MTTVLVVYGSAVVVVTLVVWAGVVMTRPHPPSDMRDLVAVSVAPLAAGLLWPLTLAAAVLWFAGRRLWAARFGHLLGGGE